jgi:glycosyltransferase involved in cell wall biosynthesis
LKKQGMDCSLIVAGAIGFSHAHEFGDDIIFQGPYDPLQSGPVFEQGDIFIHLKQNDACPSAVIEALSAGLPVIHSLSGGSPELVDQAGVGIPVIESFEKPHCPSPDEIANAVSKVVMNYPVFANRARLRAEEHFSIRKWFDRHSQIFNMYEPR